VGVNRMRTESTNRSNNVVFIIIAVAAAVKDNEELVVLDSGDRSHLSFFRRRSYRLVSRADLS
jgi:hypothetical protein